MWKPLTVVCRSHTSCNKRDLRLFGADTKHRKKRNPNKKGKSTHFLATTNFGIDLSFPWALHWQVSPALQIWLQAPMLQHKDEGHFIDYQPLFFYSFPQIPDPTQKFCTLCYREEKWTLYKAALVAWARRSSTQGDFSPTSESCQDTKSICLLLIHCCSIFSLVLLQTSPGAQKVH